MTTKTELETETAIKILRGEAAAAGDAMQVVLCDMAIDGVDKVRAELEDYALDPAEVRRARAITTREEAIGLCLAALEEGAAS